MNDTKYAFHCPGSIGVRQKLYDDTKVQCLGCQTIYYDAAIGWKHYASEAKRILRPLCRALAVELPWTVDQKRATGKPRLRKPRPARPVYPEDARIRWQRGEKTWTRKDRQMERLLKLKHELVAKMAQDRSR